MNFFSSVPLCYSKLTCKEGHSGPTYESMQAVFDLQPFRPAVNLSNPTIANISFTLYAVLGVVSVSISYLRKTLRSSLKSSERFSTVADRGNVRSTDGAFIKLSVCMGANICYCMLYF